MKGKAKPIPSVDFELIFNSLPGIVAVLNRDLEVVALNDAYLKATMITREKCIGKTLFEIFPDNPDDPFADGSTALRKSLNRVLQTKKPDNMAVVKYDIRRPASEGGEYEERIWAPLNIPVLNDNNEVQYIIHTAEDITHYIHTKESSQNLSDQIRLQSEKFNLGVIVEFTDDAVMSVTVDGIIRSYNHGAEMLYGYKESEIVGRPLTILYPKERLNELTSCLSELKEGKTIHLRETERLHKDGSIIPVSISASPLRDDEGRVIGSCSIAKDISEWKKIQNMKNEFISIVSHELRTPLTSIQGSLSLLVNGVMGEMPAGALKLLEIAKNNSERLIRLINDILDVEKMESGKMEFKIRPIQIETLVQEAVRDNEAYGEKFGVKLRITKSIPAMVNADYDRIMQVLANLLSNAIKFSASGTEVDIAITKSNQHIKVTITNYGASIPAEFQTRIFQKFAQSDSSNTRKISGTGLGLNISKQIVEKLNGRIGFNTIEGQETSFYFELPIVQAPSDKKVFSKKPYLLICEDDEDAAKYLQAMLELYNCKADIASNASDTMKMLKQNRYDALLLDLILPDRDGISVIKDIRAINQFTDLPIIVISAKASAGKDEVGSTFTVMDWIDKPIDDDRILNVLQRVKKAMITTTPQILHVEDDYDLQQVVANLIQDEARLVSVGSLKQAKEEILNNHYDLIILDLLLPDGDAHELFPLINEKHIPILVFSAYDLPPDYAEYVSKTLIKSKTSTKEFFEAIHSTLFGKKLPDKTPTE